MNRFPLVSFLACIVGCAAPMPSSSDEAVDLQGPIRIEAPVLGGTGGVPSAATATLLFSETGGVKLTYPPTSATTFPPGQANIRMWVYLDNVPAGVHVAWAIVKGPESTVVDTIPVAFTTTTTGEGDAMAVSGWPTEVTITGTHVAGAGLEFQADIPREAWLVGTRATQGAYTVEIVMDDTGVPAANAAAAGTASFTIVKE